MTDSKVVNHFAYAALGEALCTRASVARVARLIEGLPLDPEHNPIHQALANLVVSPLTPAQRRAMRAKFGF